MPITPRDAALARVPVPGRLNECKLIERELARARDGEARFIVLVGEAGAGKTRLLREVSRRPDMLALGLRLPPDRAGPEDCIEAWLGPLLRGRRRAEPADVALLASAYPRLSDFHPVGSPRPRTPVSAERAVAALARVMAQAAERRALLILADDLPQMRPEIRAFFAELAIALADARVAFLATARTDLGDPLTDRALARLLERHLVSRIDVRPLDGDGLRDLLAAELDGGIAPEILPWFKSKSGGNPLFAVELIRALQGHGILYVDRKSRSWRVAGRLTEVRLPDTIAHVLEIRRRTLAPDLARSLPLLALLGADAPSGLLARTLDLDEATVADIRQRLVRAGVFELNEAPASFAFAHPLMVEHWRAQVGGPERRRLLQTGIEFLSASICGREGSVPGLVASSCATGFELASDDELARILAFASIEAEGESFAAAQGCAAIELGRRSLRAQRPRETMSWVRRVTRGLRRCAEARTRSWFRAQCDYLAGSALHNSGRLQAAERRLRRFLDSPEARDTRIGIYAFTRLGLLLIKRGRLTEASDILTAGLTALDGQMEARARLIRCDFICYLAWIAMEQGDLDAADMLLDRARLALGELLTDARAVAGRAHILHNSAVLAAKRGSFRQAIAYLEQQVEMERQGHPTHHESKHNLAFYLALTGDLRRARTVAREALQTAGRVEDRYGTAASFVALGVVEATANNWRRAVVACERAREIARQRSNPGAWLFATAEMARACAALGDQAASERAFKEAYDAGPARNSATAEAMAHLHWARAWVLRRRGDVDGALAACREASALKEGAATPRDRARIDLVAIDAEATRLAPVGGVAPRREVEGLAQRLAAAEGYLRAEDLGPELVEIARIRLKLILAGWTGMSAEILLAEIEARLREMEAPARWDEITKEFAETALPLPHNRGATARARSEAPASRAPIAREASIDLLTPPSCAQLRIFCLGRLAVIRPGAYDPLTRTDWAGSRKARLLLAYLLAEDLEGRGVTPDAFYEAVWAESESLTLDRTFRVTMTFLRRALGSGPASARRGAGAGPIVHEEGRYRLDFDGLWCDAREFEHLLRSAAVSERSGAGEEALELRREAFALYQGEFLADFNELWIEPHRERCRTRFVRTGCILAERALRVRHLDEAQEVAERLVSCDPLSEEGHRVLIRVHLAAGRRDAAARQLECCRAILSEQLGLDLSPETNSLLALGPPASRPAHP
jgi:two-component SAPR family response regulator